MKKTVKLAFASTLLISAVPTNATTLNIQWLGASTLIFEFGDIQIITDPALGVGEKAYRMADPNENFDLSVGPMVKDHRRMQSLPAITPKEWDFILLSHSHEDHFDQVARRDLDKELPIIAPSADKELLTELGFSKQTLLDWGDTWQVSENGFKVSVTTLPAFHSENPKVLSLLGAGNGYWLEFVKDDYKKTVYWSGDSFITNSVLAALTLLGNIDLFIPHIGAVGVYGPLGKIAMDSNDAMMAIEQLQPERTLPIHHSTYDLFIEPVSVLMDKAVAADVYVDVIAPGAWLMIR